MQPNKYIQILVFILLTGNLYAANPVKVQQLINHKDWNFVENDGQLADNNVSYYGHQGGVYLYCKPGTISFAFTKVESDDNVSEARLGAKYPRCQWAGRWRCQLDALPKT